MQIGGEWVGGRADTDIVTNNLSRRRQIAGEKEPFFYRATSRIASKDFAAWGFRLKPWETVGVKLRRPPTPRAESRAPAIAPRLPRSCAAGLRASRKSVRTRCGRAHSTPDR